MLVVSPIGWADGDITSRSPAARRLHRTARSRLNRIRVPSTMAALLLAARSL